MNCGLDSFVYNKPISIKPSWYQKTCLIPLQCLQVEQELNLANKLTTKAILGLESLTRYISAARYGTSGWRGS